MTFQIRKVREAERLGWELGWGGPSPNGSHNMPLPPSLQYSLVCDVVSTLKRHRMHEQQFTHPPLLVLNSFGPHGMHVKLMATMFQNLFPSINVHKVGQASSAGWWWGLFCIGKLRHGR